MTGRHTPPKRAKGGPHNPALTQQATIRTAKPPTVMIAYLHPTAALTPHFCRSLTMLEAREFHVNPGRLHAICPHESSANVAHARNECARKLLETDADYLWFVDSDMTFDVDILDELLAVADPKERPIIGGLCFGVRPERGPDGETLPATKAGSFFLELFPTVYMVHEDGMTRQHFQYPKDQVFQVHSTGAACLLIHRSVFEHPGWYEEDEKGRPHPMPWFRESVLQGHICSEDQFFCLKAGSLGFPIWINGKAKTGHAKVFVADEAHYERMWALRQLTAQAQRNEWCPPAPDEVAVVVPAMRRPDAVAPFVRSLRASTGMATPYFVCDPDDVDEIAAVKAAGASLILSEGTSFASKCNTGFRATSEPWVLFVGDDVRFWPGWWDQVWKVAAETGAGLISTNDMGNPRVVQGEHAIHPVMSRKWVDEMGASWDGPGVVAHEGYGHCFVDDEWTVVAKQQGMFAFALWALVEHLHPLWRKGEEDDVYRKGQASFDRDRELFTERLATFARREVAA